MDFTEINKGLSEIYQDAAKRGDVKTLVQTAMVMEAVKDAQTDVKALVSMMRRQDELMSRVYDL